MREKDKEYQKLKNQYDKMKRKALLGLPEGRNHEHSNLPNPNQMFPTAMPLNHQVMQDRNGGSDFQGQSAFLPPPPMKNRNSGHNGPSLSQVVDGMEATGIQRTPIRSATGGMFGAKQPANKWQGGFGQHHRMPGPAMSDRSDSANEVEGLLFNSGHPQRLQANMKGNSRPSHFGAYGPHVKRLKAGARGHPMGQM